MSGVETIMRPVARPGHGGFASRRAVAQVMDWQAGEEISAEWEELARASLDPNPFLEPAFALSLAQHCPQESKPRFLAIRETWGERRLIALFALDRQSAASWKSPFIALGSPLLRHGSTRLALDAAIAWLRAEMPSAPGFFFTRMDARGPTCRAILTYAVRSKLPMQEFDRHYRAAMRRSGDGQMRQVTGKRRKEMGRLLRRLQDKGEVAFSSATTIPQVRAAMESFLRLEGQGWKGKRGTALVCNPVLATFTRVALRRLAGLSKCRIETMSFNGKPIAMGIVLQSQEHAAFWKIAFDEDYAAYSPGAQLTLAMARGFAQHEEIALVDSCAVPDHPMIDHYWAHRREIVDILVGCGDAAQFQSAVQMELARRNLRRIAKTAYLTLTGRQAP